MCTMAGMCIEELNMQLCAFASSWNNQKLTFNQIELMSQVAKTRVAQLRCFFKILT